MKEITFINLLTLYVALTTDSSSVKSNLQADAFNKFKFFLDAEIKGDRNLQGKKNAFIQSFKTFIENLDLAQQRKETLLQIVQSISDHKEMKIKELIDDYYKEKEEIDHNVGNQIDDYLNFLQSKAATVPVIHQLYHPVRPNGNHKLNKEKTEKTEKSKSKSKRM